jgi:hypothetical protein
MLRRLKPLIIIVYSILLASCSSQGWRQLSPATSPPSSGQGAVAFMDSSNTAILFGGITVDKWLNETWIWNGKTWHQVFPANSPPAREKLTMVYDKSRDKAVLFGGLMDKTLFNDTWEWDGQNWKLMNPAHRPPARCCHGMAYDSVNKDLIIYGGYDPNRKVFLSDIWKWDGNDWTEISCCNMTQMSGHVMISFPPKNEIVSVQTSGYGTWAWDSKIWKNLGIENPPPRSEGRIAYDTNHRWAIFFGGITENQLLNDTWVFDGNKWLHLFFPKSPPERYGHVMFYDSGRESIILFGGIGNNTFLGDTWELKLPNNLSSFEVEATPFAIP